MIVGRHDLIVSHRRRRGGKEIDCRVAREVDIHSLGRDIAIDERTHILLLIRDSTSTHELNPVDSDRTKVVV